MPHLIRQLSVGIGLLLFVATSIELRGPKVPQGDVPDAFEVFSRLPFIVAISDSNNDTMFECLSAKRTYLDLQAKEVAYAVLFKGHHGTQKKNVGFHVTAGPTPNIVFFTEDEHPDITQIAEVMYSNNRNCFILHFPYFGEQCVLYVSKGFEDKVPPECTHRFADICRVVVPLYSRDLCADDDKEL